MANNKRIVFDLLTKKYKYSSVGAAAIVGNLIAESGVNPKRSEGSKLPKNEPTPNLGYGIAQWTFPSRQKNLMTFAKRKNLPVSNLSVQVEFMLKELNSLKGLNRRLKTGQETIAQLTTEFCNEYEKPGIPHLEKRIKFARDVYKKYSK